MLETPAVGLLRRLFDSFQLTPTFAELEQANRAASASYPRERVVAELLTHASPAPGARDELERLLHTRPFDAAARTHARTLLGPDPPPLMRPGNVEIEWYLEGLLDRLRTLDE